MDFLNNLISTPDDSARKVKALIAINRKKLTATTSHAQVFCRDDQDIVESMAAKQVPVVLKLKNFDRVKTKAVSQRAPSMSTGKFESTVGLPTFNRPNPSPSKEKKPRT